ncbi:MAG: sigma-70 family RNA polymerase sigma factor [Gemmatimonadota bacterium]
MTEPATSDAVFEREVLPELDAVYRFALRLARDPEQAEDLVQETFLKAYRNRTSYTPGTRARSWLFTICRNAFLRREERSRRHREIVAEAVQEDPARQSGEAAVFQAARERDPEGAFWSQVVDEEILRAIDELPDEFREAVVLSDLEDLSYNEIARVLSLPIGTVKSRLFRGRRILQKRLYEYALAEGIFDRPRSEASNDYEEGSR